MNEIYFYRDKKDTNYTILDNTFIRDERLSWKAKGLMTYLLSLPEDWKIYLKEVEKHASDGRDSLRSALKPLIKYGYIVFEQKRTEKGNFGDCIYKIIENPKAPQTEKPYTENPTAEKPNTENPHLLNTNNTKYLCKLNTDINNKAKKFTKPTLEDVKAYVRENKYSVDAERFIDYYESNGWKVGKNSMKDWKACVRTWNKNSTRFGYKKKNAMYEQDHPDDVGEILF